MQYGLWHPTIFHSVNAAEPAQSAVSKKRVHGGQASSCKNLDVGHFVAPLNVEDAPKAVHMEVVQLTVLLGVCCPSFTAVEEGADDACFVHCHLG